MLVRAVIEWCWHAPNLVLIVQFIQVEMVISKSWDWDSRMSLQDEEHDLPTRKKKIDEVNKKQPSSQLLSMALARNHVNNEDQQNVEGKASMANSFVGGSVNVRKTRIIYFERTDHLRQGAPVMQYRSRIRLIMCERGKDGMVEAVVQFGDDQDDDFTSSIPHDILPLLPNTHYADMLAMQFCALMVKDGYKLTEDQVQPILLRPNVPPNVASNV